jgi:hypothetical protein
MCPTRGFSHPLSGPRKRKRAHPLARPLRPGEPVAVPPDNQQCSYEGRVDFRGADLDLSFVNAPSAQDCCMVCHSDPLCNAFTYQPLQGVCYLKTARGRASLNNDLVSGVVVRADAVQRG